MLQNFMQMLDEARGDGALSPFTLAVMGHPFVSAQIETTADQLLT